MFVIASNISTRDPKIKRSFDMIKENRWVVTTEAAGFLQDIAKKCDISGASALEVNLQQYFDTPVAMQAAVNILQKVVNLPLCLSSNSAETLHAGIDACRTPPIVNFVILEESRLRGILPIIAQHKGSVVFLVSDPASPADAKEMLERAAVLVGAANEMGIPNERIFLDPGLIHIGNALGQRHLPEVMDFIQVSLEAFPQPVRTTCWLPNISSGIPKRLKSVIETTLLAMLTGLGLNSVFLNALEPENIKALRLIKIFNNETVYADSLIDL